MECHRRFVRLLIYLGMGIWHPGQLASPQKYQLPKKHWTLLYRGLTLCFAGCLDLQTTWFGDPGWFFRFFAVPKASEYPRKMIFVGVYIYPKYFPFEAFGNFSDSYRSFLSTQKSNKLESHLPFSKFFMKSPVANSPRSVLWIFTEGHDWRCNKMGWSIWVLESFLLGPYGLRLG